MPIKYGYVKPYPPIPYGARVKKRIRDELEDLVKSIKDYVPGIRTATIHNKEDLMKLLKGTDFDFITRHASETDKEILFKHPFFQDLITESTRKPETKSIEKQLIKREKQRLGVTTLTRDVLTRIKRQARRKFETSRTKTMARAKIQIEPLVNITKRKWQERTVRNPTRRAEELIVWRNKKGKLISRYKGTTYSPRQINYIKSNIEKNIDNLQIGFNNRFPNNQRSFSAIRKVH